jgi:RNA polymerase sigma-70 factor, ECF subfamily
MDHPQPEDEVEAWAEEIADVAAAKAGDREAFARLYRGFGPMVHAIVLSRARHADAADLVQDVFVVALRRLAELRDPAAFGGWLATIARHRAVDHLRRPDPLGAGDVETLDEEAAMGARTIPAEAIAALRAIRSLPEAYRETLTMRLVEGMTGPEIARRTGLSAGSVRVNLHRGMKLLRRRLGGGVEHE